MKFKSSNEIEPRKKCLNVHSNLRLTPREKEAHNNSVSVRQQGEGDLGAFSLDEFKELIQNKINQSLLKF